MSAFKKVSSFSILLQETNPHNATKTHFYYALFWGCDSPVVY
jgi:hypothetical protein